MPGAVGRSVDVSVVDAIVVIETWLAEDDGDGIASRHIICSGDTIHANIQGIDISLSTVAGR